MSGIGNEVQARAIAENVADAAVKKFALENPHLFAQQSPRMEIPAPLKWAAAIVAALMTMAVTGSIVWGASTLNGLQLTVARMDERQQRDTTPARLDKIEDRLARLEQAQQPVEARK